MPRSHFALFQKYLPGITSRSGQPCSGVSGSPSASVASSALSSSRNSIGTLDGEALLGVRDDEAGARLRAHELRDLAPVNAAEARVEAAPARDAVDVLHVLRLRQRGELVPAQRDRVLDLAEDAEVPRREIRVRHRAGVQHRPLLREVLARREARGVVPGGRDLLFGPTPEHAAYTNCDEARDSEAAARVRPRRRSRRRRLPAADGLERRRGARARRELRGAAAHGEGAGDRAAARAATRRRRLPPADRARARRPRARRARAHALRGQGRGRARGARVDARLRRAAAGRAAERRLRPGGLGGARRRRRRRADRARGARASPHRGRHRPASAPRSTTACFPPKRA